jgi:hypothetical protein
MMVAVLIFAVLGMNGYIRRSLAGKVKSNVDSTFGKPLDVHHGEFTGETYAAGDASFVNRMETADGRVVGADGVVLNGSTPVYFVGYQTLGRVAGSEVARAASANQYTTVTYSKNVINWSAQ